MGTFKSSKGECSISDSTWPVQSKLLVNLPEERLPGNNWPPRLPVNLPLGRRRTLLQRIVGQETTKARDPTEAARQRNPGGKGEEEGERGQQEGGARQIRRQGSQTRRTQGRQQAANAQGRQGSRRTTIILLLFNTLRHF